MLEDLINAPNDDSDYYKTPPLGRHYTLRWAQEDLQVQYCCLHITNSQKLLL